MRVESANSYVLFPIGAKRFALPSATVRELARPAHLQVFPHTTPLLIGVLVRRGRIVPACDIAQVLTGPAAPERKFYLIATYHLSGGEEWIALPVTGECELVTANSVAPTRKLPKWIAGLLSRDGEIVEILDLDRLIAEHAGDRALAAEAES